MTEQLSKPLVDLLEIQLRKQAVDLYSKFAAAGWDPEHIRNRVALISQMDWQFCFQNGRIPTRLRDWES